MTKEKLKQMQDSCRNEILQRNKNLVPMKEEDKYLRGYKQGLADANVIYKKQVEKLLSIFLDHLNKGGKN